MLVSFWGNAQKCDIDIKISGYDNDTLLIAYFYGDNQLIKDTLFAVEPGVFNYKEDTLIDAGVYLGIVFPSNNYFQFIVNPEDQKFKLITSIDKLQKVKAKGSKDNKVFFDYLEYIGGKNKEAKALAKEKENKGLAEDKKAQILQKIGKLDEQVNEYQEGIIEDYPDFVTTMLIKMNRDIKVPEFIGEKDSVKMKRYLYYKKHYFDNIDFKNDALLFTPDIHNKITNYMDNLTPPYPDSINVSIDHVLGMMSENSEIWRYYVAHFLNKYGQSNIIGMDAVYVHMAKEYYGKGKTPWVDEKTLVRILDNAIRMEDVLIGKIVPNITLYKKDNTPVKIHDIDAKYLVLYFWKPDCSHCRNSMPDLVKFSNAFKDKGVKVIGICTKLGKKTKKCWDGVNDLGMKVLYYNLADPKNLSSMHSAYNIRSTPTVFILNKDKEILMKQIPTKKLGEIMEKIIKVEG